MPARGTAAPPRAEEHPSGRMPSREARERAEQAGRGRPGQGGRNSVLLARGDGGLGGESLGPFAVYNRCSRPLYTPRPPPRAEYAERQTLDKWHCSVDEGGWTEAGGTLPQTRRTRRCAAGALQCSVVCYRCTPTSGSRAGTMAWRKSKRRGVAGQPDRSA